MGLTNRFQTPWPSLWSLSHVYCTSSSINPQRRAADVSEQAWYDPVTKSNSVFKGKVLVRFVRVSRIPLISYAPSVHLTLPGIAQRISLKNKDNDFFHFVGRVRGRPVFCLDYRMFCTGQRQSLVYLGSSI